MRGVLERTNVVLHDRRFFRAVLVFFVLESMWIALSATYPQAFDENFHFGIIKIYSHYWLPFLGSQPTGADAYGAVFRDPSYLYHYLMSFPYRLIALPVHSQTAQVILLRFINIGLVGIGLMLFRRVLVRARVSQKLANVSLLLFVLIPVVPQLAGQINYDNLLFPLVAWTCLLAMQAADELAAKRPSTRTLVTFAAVCIFATLVKYEFMPIAAGAGLFLIYLAYRNFRGSWRLLGTRLCESWQQQRPYTRMLLVLAVVAGLGLFAQRDGFNLVKYHALVPECSSVLSIQSCSAYGPWSATYQRHQVVVTAAQSGTVHFDNPLAYTGVWLYWLWYRLFFAVNGPAANFKNYPPLPLPAAAALLIGIGGVAAVIVRWRYTFRGNPYLTFFAIVTGLYLAALWAEGYLQYRHTDTLVLMNGRYLLPILLPAAAIVGCSLSAALRRRHALKTSFASLAILLFLQGGGVFTFIMRSDASWDWPNAAAVKINNGARTVLRPIIVEGSKTYSTQGWFFN